MFDDMTKADKQAAKRALLWFLAMLLFVIAIGGGGDERAMLDLR